MPSTKVGSAKTRGGGRTRRPVQNRRRSRGAAPAWVAVAGALAVLAVLIVVVRDQGSPTSPSTYGGVAHVHGLGINPADGDLYAATHLGLYRVPAQGRAQRVGDAVQDTMGFSVVGPDRFLGSGHPDPKDKHLRKPGSPPLLGLIESTDGGQTWKPLSLLGEADFHSLVAANGKVYGYDSTGGRFLVSDDGERWDTRSEIVIGTFAVDPADADHVVAMTERGLATSGDGGRSWQPVDGPPLAFVSWGTQLGLWGVSRTGQTYQRTATGWEPRAALAGEPQALLVAGPDVYAAASAGDATAIYRSSDGGSSWQLRYADKQVQQ